ncbi:MAG: hypothetical protein HYR72_12570 [Deltaproteobacteria bacterium]|nr:hypothetical protein [Deltaproteobacteria bacterium]MBI3387856.1 hypothetical protein [Deltaproteobacteria bacterium]
MGSHSEEELPGRSDLPLLGFVLGTGVSVLLWAALVAIAFWAVLLR